MPELDGRVALITGAGGMRGVGRATVMKLAGLGADIALSDVHLGTSDLPPAEVRNEWGGIDTVSQEVQALGRRAVPVYCDLSDPRQIESHSPHARPFVAVVACDLSEALQQPSGEDTVRGDRELAPSPESRRHLAGSPEVERAAESQLL